MDPDVAAPLAAGPSLPRAGLMVAPAMAVANGLNYAFNLVMLRLLEPAAYGALGALLAVILIGTVPGLALQAVVARHTALRAADGRAVLSGAPRLAPATAALGREVGAAALAFLGLLLLTNMDLLLARHYLAAEPSGLYAAGAVVAKIAYWAPQFVATIVFPRLATEAAARRRLLARAAAAIAALGVALMVVVAAAPELAVTLPFGAAYRDVGPDLPLFAALGTALALVQLLLFSAIAAGDRKVHRLIGATVVVEVAVIALGPHHSVTGIVGAALAAVTALLGACWVLERRRQPVEAAP